jgi:hypothetical protein
MWQKLAGQHAGPSTVGQSMTDTRSLGPSTRRHSDTRTGSFSPTIIHPGSLTSPRPGSLSCFRRVSNDPLVARPSILPLPALFALGTVQRGSWARALGGCGGGGA